MTTGIAKYLSARAAQRSRAWTSIRSVLRQATAREDHLPVFLVVCDQSIVSLANFAMGVIIGRVCGRAELGAYALAWTLVILATELPATLTTTPYTVFSPQLSRDQRSLYLGSILVHQLLVSVLFALAIAVGAFLGLRRGWLSPSVSNVITTTACVTVFIGLREFVRRVSFAELEVGVALLVDVVVCLTQAGGVFLLLHFGALNASRVYIVLGIASALVAGGWLALHWRGFHLDARLCARDLKRNWGFAKWVLGSWIVAAVAMYLYPWLLAAFHGTSATGAWSACAAIVALGNPILMGLGNYVGPQIHSAYAASGIPAMQRSVYRSSLLLTMLLLPIVLVLVGGGDRIVIGVYGKTYAGNASVVILLALNMLISALTYPYSRGLYSLECAKADMLVNVVAVTVLFTVGIAAVRSYGVQGAAASLLLSTAVGAVIRIGVFAREVRRRKPEGPIGARHFAIESATDNGCQD